MAEETGQSMQTMGYEQTGGKKIPLEREGNGIPYRYKKR